jgi:hypothetical protein
MLAQIDADQRGFVHGASLPRTELPSAVGGIGLAISLHMRTISRFSSCFAPKKARFQDVMREPIFFTSTLAVFATITERVYAKSNPF